MPICQGLECILLKKVGTRRAGRHRKSLMIKRLRSCYYATTSLIADQRIM